MAGQVPLLHHSDCAHNMTSSNPVVSNHSFFLSYFWLFEIYSHGKSISVSPAGQARTHSYHRHSIHFYHHHWGLSHISANKNQTNRRLPYSLLDHINLAETPTPTIPQTEQIITAPCMLRSNPSLMSQAILKCTFHRGPSPSVLRHPFHIQAV